MNFVHAKKILSFGNCSKEILLKQNIKSGSRRKKMGTVANAKAVWNDVNRGHFDLLTYIIFEMQYYYTSRSIGVLFETLELRWSGRWCVDFCGKRHFIPPEYHSRTGARHERTPYCSRPESPWQILKSGFTKYKK